MNKLVAFLVIIAILVAAIIFLPSIIPNLPWPPTEPGHPVEPGDPGNSGESSGNGESGNGNPGNSTEPGEPGDSPNRPLAVWVVYWDQQTAMAEARILAESLEVVSHFSTLFDEYGSLSIPDNTLNMHHEMMTSPLSSEPLHFLTLVNDVVFADGRPSLLKDRAVMELLLATPESRAKHIADIVYLIERYGFDGVELDYETLHRQPGLAELFALFCFELWEVLEPQNIALRIVLEPSFPVARIELPAGPDYVVMFYNLFGPGTAPGPKADEDFIRRTAQIMQALPGSVTIAFATGGFVWTEGSTAAQGLTEAQAWELLVSSGAEANRDPGSGALYFSYTGPEGLMHTVWFADGETLNHWMDIANDEVGTYRFAIWRLGNNRPESFEILN